MRLETRLLLCSCFLVSLRLEGAVMLTVSEVQLSVYDLVVCPARRAVVTGEDF